MRAPWKGNSGEGRHIRSHVDQQVFLLLPQLLGAGTREDMWTTEEGTTRGQEDRVWRDGLCHWKAVSLYAALKHRELRLCPHHSRPLLVSSAKHPKPWMETQHSRGLRSSHCVSWAGLSWELWKALVHYQYFEVPSSPTGGLEKDL